MSDVKEYFESAYCLEIPGRVKRHVTTQPQRTKCGSNLKIKVLLKAECWLLLIGFQTS